MTNYLQLRDRIKQFYVRNEVYLYPVIKFFLSLLSLIMINTGMGYMTGLKSAAVALGVSLLCSLLPTNFTILAAAAFILLHSYAMALECAIVVLAVFTLILLLYFRFSPKDAMVVLITPLSFMIGIPYVMPIALGLLSAPSSIVSMSCGTIVYYMIKFIADNRETFSAKDAETGTIKFRLMMDGLLDNKLMFSVIIIFALTLIAVYMIRRSSTKYSWRIAVFFGIVMSALLLLFSKLIVGVEISVITVLIGEIVSLCISLVIEFMEFNVDYAKMEIVQFEDDEYYYYVKAIPKNAVSAPSRKVRRVNKPQKRQQKKPVSTVNKDKPVNRVHTIKTANGVSRTRDE